MDDRRVSRCAKWAGFSARRVSSDQPGCSGPFDARAVGALDRGTTRLLTEAARVINALWRIAWPAVDHNAFALHARRNRRICVRREGISGLQIAGDDIALRACTAEQFAGARQTADVAAIHLNLRI